MGGSLGLEGCLVLVAVSGGESEPSTVMLPSLATDDQNHKHPDPPEPPLYQQKGHIMTLLSASDTGPGP